MKPVPWPLAGWAVAWWLALLPCVVQAGMPMPVPAAPSERNGPLLPSAVVTAAVRIHPAVLAAQVELAHAQGEATQLRLFLHNPQVAASTSVDGRRTSGSASQPLSLTGEGIAARKAAVARVDAARFQLQRARLEAAAACRRAYADAVVRSRQVDIAVEGRGLATQLRDAVARQLEVGEASTLDLRLAELALVQASARLLEARRMEADALRQLAGLSGLMVDGSELVTDPREVVSVGAPDGSMQGQRSDLLAQQSTVRQATALRTRQRASTLAPVGVGVAMNVEDGERFVGPTLQATLPLFDRNQAGRQSAEAGLEQAHSTEASLRALVLTEQITARTRVAEALDLEASGLKHPLEEARAALSSIDTGYRAGEIDLPSAILLQKEVLAGESAALDLLGGIAQARVDLLLAHDDARLLGEATASGPGGAP